MELENQLTQDKIQFLQELVKEQRELEQQIKILSKAVKDRKERKKQVDLNLIKYFKTNDINHVNLKSSNCRIECITKVKRTGLSQKYVNEMLAELLKDEDLAREMLNYILSGRKQTQEYQLKTVENADKRKIKPQKAIKSNDEFNELDKKNLIKKIKSKLDNPYKSNEGQIDLQIIESTVNPNELTSNILKQELIDEPSNNNTISSNTEIEKSKIKDNNNDLLDISHSQFRETKFDIPNIKISNNLGLIDENNLTFNKSKFAVTNLSNIIQKLKT